MANEESPQIIKGQNSKSCLGGAYSHKKTKSQLSGTLQNLFNSSANHEVNEPQRKSRNHSRNATSRIFEDSGEIQKHEECPFTKINFE